MDKLVISGKEFSSRLFLGTGKFSSNILMVVLLFCDCISQLPGFQGTLPINAVTSLIGAPIIIWIILKNKGN